MMPQSGNNGIVEWWNSGFFKGYDPILVLWFRRRRSINPTLQNPKTHFSNIPVFQHSNWAEPPNL